MTNLIAAGYMIQDVQGSAIYGVGASIDEAWAKAAAEAGPFFNACGDTISDDEAYETQFKAYAATAALIRKVNEFGGGITWDVVGCIACTVEEAEAE